ncbi:1543_t:CDS:2 [Funneliformis geosporum]|nr:1543_t:CDS:2 [Funneliformis geosporum]
MNVAHSSKSSQRTDYSDSLSTYTNEYYDSNFSLRSYASSGVSAPKKYFQGF